MNTCYFEMGDVARVSPLTPTSWVPAFAGMTSWGRDDDWEGGDACRPPPPKVDLTPCAP